MRVLHAGLRDVAFALWMRNPAPSVAQVEKALQGNLCRCTGYASIVRAAMAGAADPAATRGGGASPGRRRSRRCATARA
jgi:xanthine dehydrogenase small subunit